MADGKAAHHRGGVALVVGRQCLGPDVHLLDRLAGQIGEIGRRQQLAIGSGGLRQVGQFRVVAVDPAAEFFELFAQPVECAGDACRGRAERVLVEHQHAKICEPRVPRRRQEELVADAFGQRIGAG